MEDKIKSKESFEKMQDSSFDSWYEVTYIKHHGCYQYHHSDLVDICRVVRLRLENINGMGRGTLFFTTEDDKLMVLNWAAIIAMIPIKE